MAEVSVSEVINILDKQNITNIILIKDYSEKKCCGEQLKNLSFEQIGKKLGYLNEGCCVDKETMNILIVPNGYYKTWKQWTSRYNCDSDSDFNCYECYEIKNKNNKSYIAMKKNLCNELLSRKKCTWCEKSGT